MSLALALGVCWCLLGAAAAGGYHTWDMLATGITKDDGSHWFFVIGKLDDLKIMEYNTQTQRVKPTREWVKEAVDATYFLKKTQEFQWYEERSKAVTNRWMWFCNQTSGLHVLQVHVGCTLDGDTALGRKFQYAYDGQDFISFDVQTGTWVAAMQPAVFQKQLWDGGPHWRHFAKRYLQTECLETLRSLVRAGNEILERQERPRVQVSDRLGQAGLTTLSCRVHGFYPRDVAVVWLKDGVAVPQETKRWEVLPSGDGTYQTRATINIDPSRETNYTCCVEHASLEEDLRVDWAPKSNVVLIVGVVGVLLLVAAVAGAVVCLRKKDGYRVAAGNEGSSRSR